MGETVPAADAKTAPNPEPKPALPADLRDELFLKFAGTATVIVGLVLLVASVIAMGVLSVLKFDLGPWVPILPLSLLVILVGGLVTVYFRKVIERTLNPQKPEPARPPYGFVYPYQMPPPAYPMRIPAPGAPPPGVPATWGPAIPGVAARPGSKFCIKCGRRIPTEAKFCPYCRHAYSA